MTGWFQVVRRGASCGAALLMTIACGHDSGARQASDSLGGQDRAIVVYNAGSLALPLRAALDSFAEREHVTVQQENAGSLETARKLTELGKIPDLVAVAD